MDAQANLVSLAMELLEDAPEMPDKLYIYIYREDIFDEWIAECSQKLK